MLNENTNRLYLSYIRWIFDIVNDDNLMTNHEQGKKRPTYFTIKDIL